MSTFIFILTKKKIYRFEEKLHYFAYKIHGYFYFAIYAQKTGKNLISDRTHRPVEVHGGQGVVQVSGHGSRRGTVAATRAVVAARFLRVVA